MGVLKKIYLAGLMVIVAGFAQNASAYLTASSLDKNKWDGYKNYKQDGLDLTLTFNVYDIIAHPSEVTAWAGSVDFGFPAGDRYVYAYQLFSNSLSLKDVAYFGILDKNGNHIEPILMHGTQAVGDDGVKPDPNPSHEEDQGIWKWTKGGGFILATEHSAYLVFSSSYAPVRGKFEVKSSEESEPPVPEPATIALFCVASGFLVARRNRTRRAA
jgi:hypothetical protein